MIDDLSAPISAIILVRCLAAVLLVLGGTTALGALLMTLPTEQRVRRRLALAIVAPLLGLVGVAAVVRGLP